MKFACPEIHKRSQSAWGIMIVGEACAAGSSGTGLDVSWASVPGCCCARQGEPSVKRTSVSNPTGTSHPATFLKCFRVCTDIVVIIYNGSGQARVFLAEDKDSKLELLKAGEFTLEYSVTFSAAFSRQFCGQTKKAVDKSGSRPPLDNSHRVDPRVLNRQAPMQMWAGDPAGGADFPYL